MSNYKELGSEKVYNNQVECAEEVLARFFKGDSQSILLDAEPQLGKTGVFLYLIDFFVRSGNNFIYLSNISQNTLREQSFGRILKAGIFANAKNVQHLSGADSDHIADVLSQAGKNNLLIIDECHIAQNDGKKLVDLLDKAGINYGANPKTWRNKNVKVLSVSATPYAHHIQMLRSKQAFEVVKLGRGEAYYGLSDLYLQGRAHQTQLLFEKDKLTGMPVPSRFLAERVQEFMHQNGKYGPGVGIFRLSSRAEEEEFRKFVLSQYEGKTPWVDIEAFHHSYGNLPMLTSYITECSRPRILVIYDSLGAGVTVSSTRHLRIWVDRPSKHADTVAQSAGRCCGYGDRQEDKFNVYCNLEEMQAAVDWYSGNGSIPSGVQNPNDFEAVADRIDYNTRRRNSSFVSLGASKQEALLNLKRVCEEIIGVPLAKWGIAVKAATSVMCENTKNNLYHAVIDGVNRIGYEFDEDSQGNPVVKLRIYHFTDKPPQNSSYTGSYEKLSLDRPELVGHFLFHTGNAHALRDYILGKVQRPPGAYDKTAVADRALKKGFSMKKYKD